MKDMFYNYDNDVMVDNVFRLPLEIPPKDLDFAGKPYVVRTVKGDAVGVKTRINARTRLFFHLACDRGPEFLADLLAHAEIHLEVLNRCKLVVLDLSDLIENYVDDQTISVAFTTGDASSLPSGLYKLNLYMLVEGVKYSLFTENDGYLCIE